MRQRRNRRKGAGRVNNASRREWEPGLRKWGQPKAKVMGERDSSGGTGGSKREGTSEGLAGREKGPGRGGGSEEAG